MITISTPLVDHVTADPADVRLLLARLNAEAVGSAYVFDDAEHSISLVAAHFIHDETLEDRSAELAAYGILQLIQGEMIAGELADRVSGAPAGRAHPTNGERSDPDEMLFVAQRLFIPAGEKPSTFAVEEVSSTRTCLRSCAQRTHIPLRERVASRQRLIDGLTLWRCGRERINLDGRQPHHDLARATSRDSSPRQRVI